MELPWWLSGKKKKKKKSICQCKSHKFDPCIRKIHAGRFFTTESRAAWSCELPVIKMGLLHFSAPGDLEWSLVT